MVSTSMTLNVLNPPPQKKKYIWGFSVLKLFLAIFGCDAHFKSELH